MRVLINIDVDDLERAVAFYTAAFELTVGRRFADGSAVELLGADSAFYVLVKPAGGVRTYVRHWTPVHIDLVVDDVAAAVARAVAAGAILETPPASHTWGEIAMLADPFGHGFCVLAFSDRGYDALLAPSP